MELNSLRGLTSSELKSVVTDKRVVIFSPRSRSRNIYMAEFTADANTTLYRLLRQDAALAAFLDHLSEELIASVPNMGTQTQKALRNQKASIVDLADSLAGDLTKTAISTLILDEFDRLEVTNETVEFFERFVEKMPSTIQLVLNGRSFSYYPWNRMVQAGTAIVLGEEQALAGGMFSATEAEHPHIEVYAFGSGAVRVNGLPVDTWDGPLPRNLFYYFVDHPMVTRDEIFSTFWPELNTKEATNVFHVTKRKISERLGYELTAYSGGFYRPSNEVHLHYDVRSFEDSYKVGRGKQDRSSINDWYNVIRLYRSEFLHELDMPWINERRDSLRDMYAEALINVARMHQSARDFDKAIHYFLRGLREQPLREDIYRALMTIYHQQGDHNKAIELYKTLEDMLYRRLKIKPSGTTTQLYNLILNEMP